MVGRKGQPIKERKLTASVVRSNNLEKGLMLLTCIRAVGVLNQNCSTDCANRRSSQHFSVPRGNADKICVIKLLCSKIFSVSGTEINVSNGKLCVHVCMVCVCVCVVCMCAYHLCKLTVSNLVVRVPNCKQYIH
jgi:hypothetical protein